MKIYQVGGAVRDKVLGIVSQDTDYLVVGATVDEMIEQGFQSVGKSFPVFLHPQTKQEYALARKEVKTGDKHTDFHFVFDKTISLKEDIQRRDFTINGLVYDEENDKIIDLVGGLVDIENKIIRHINSVHFVEDPLRVLRMCRFCAQLDFEIHPTTMALAQKMVRDKMLIHLTKERVFKELEKALNTAHFDKFILAMRSCGALKEILPEIDMLFNIPEKEKYHPEKNSGDHTILSLKCASCYSAELKYAVLLHDVGKIKTPPAIWPSHYGHDIRGAELIKQISNRLKVPTKYKNMALFGCKHHMMVRNVPKMDLDILYDFVSEISSKFKSKEKIEHLFLICKADMQGRAIPLDKKEFDNLENAKNRCFSFYQKMQSIKAKDMPNFDSLQKNKTFQTEFKRFCLEKLANEDI